MIRFGIESQYGAWRMMVGLLKCPSKINANALNALAFIPAMEQEEVAVVA